MANDEPTMLYYNEAGQQVPEGDPAARWQYLSDDQARPDAPRRASNVVESRGAPAPESVTAVPDGAEVVEATKEPTDEKAQAAPKATKARTSSANK